MEARFANYEEFSSSLVLLPFIDDSCVGAKVFSHKPPPNTQTNVENHSLVNVPLSEEKDDTSTPDDNKSPREREAEDDQVNENNVSPKTSESVGEINAADAEDAGNSSGEADKNSMSNDNGQPHGEASPEIIENGEGSNGPDHDGINVETRETIAEPREDEMSTIIPADYVLIKMKTSGNDIEIGELEHKEFTELLTLLRDAVYPLSLVFVPPNEIVTVADSSGEYGSDDDAEGVEESQSSAQSSSDDDDDDDNDDDDESAKVNPSVDEAAKYAKQAALELRGRLSRWGSVAATRASAAAEVAATRASAAAEVAATRASQAASVVQELRESRIKEEVKKKQTVVKDASTSEWLPMVEPISDEETLDSSSKNCEVLTGGGNEVAESSNDQLTPNTSQDDDNEGQIEQGTGPESCDNGNASEYVNVVETETSSLVSLRLNQLETQLAEANSRLEVKSTALSKLQQKLDASMNERKKIQNEARLSKKDLEAKNSKNDKKIVTLNEELQIRTKALTKCEAELEEKKKKVDNLVAGNREKELEHEKAMKALNNELSVCKAAIEARDSKVETLQESITELKTKLSAQAKELSAVDSLRIDLTQSKSQSSTAVQVIEKMKKDESEFQNELKEAKGIVDELNKKYTAAKAAATKCTAEVDKMKAECRRLKMERNSLKTKAESLQKEMNQITKISQNNKVDTKAFDKLQKELQQLRLVHIELQRDLEAERIEKRDLKAELNASRLAHQNPIINYIPTAGGDGSPRIEELERIISEMTEYSSAQSLQIETLRQINAALTEDIRKTD